MRLGLLFHVIIGELHEPDQLHTTASLPASEIRFMFQEKSDEREHNDIPGDIVDRIELRPA